MTHLQKTGACVIGIRPKQNTGGWPHYRSVVESSSAACSEAARSEEWKVGCMHGAIIRMETAWGNSAASWAEAGFVGFPQSPQNIRSKRLRRNEEGVNIARGKLAKINKGSNNMAVKADRISKYQIICFDSSAKVDNRKTTIKYKGKCV